MAQQITPLAPSLPATTAIQDPAVRRFASAVADILRNAQSTEFAVQSLAKAADALSGGSGTPPSIAQWLLSSELYQRLSEGIERVDLAAKQAIVQEQIDRANSIADEAQARANEIAAEVAARIAAVQAEADARANALLSEATARGAAISNEATIRQAADASLAQDITALTAAVGDNAAAIQDESVARVNALAAEAAARNTLAAQMRGSYDGSSLDQVTSGLIYQERIARSTAVDGLAQQITLLSASAGEQFDYHKIWYFDSGVEGWSGNGAPTVSGGWIRPANHDTAPYLISPTGIGANGATHTQIRLRVRKLGTPTWAGALWWRLAGDATWDVARRVSIDEPTYDASGIGLVTVNLPWSGSIDRIRVDLSASQTASVGYEVDWLAIGRPAPGASSAALLAESQARAVADAAEVSAREALSTKVTGAANPASLTLDTLASGLLFDERQARSTADSTEVTARQNLAAKITGFTDPAGKSLVDLTAGLIYEERTARATQDTALATSISTLSARVGTAEAGIVSEATARANADSALSSQLTALSATVGSNTAAITSEADARANADSALTTQINTVSSVANGRNRTFRQSTAPTGAVNGDIWYDTANNNSIKRWNGSSWVTTDNTRIASNEAAIVSEATTRANNDTSIVNAVNTMWAITGATNALSQSGNNIVTNWTTAQANYWSNLDAEVFTSGGQTIRAALQQEATTRANADGSLGAQWTLKTDINGYLAGFGFASTANNATPISDFIIRADRFAVAMPGYGEHVPFAIGPSGAEFSGLTSWSKVQGTGKPQNNATVGATFGDYYGNGKNISGTITPGNVTTYIANAAIGNAQIDRASVNKLRVGTADILDANITTLKVSGNAITVPVHSYTAGDVGFYSPGALSWVTIQSAWIDPQGQNVFCLATGDWPDSNVDDQDTHMRIVAPNGTQLAYTTKGNRFTLVGTSNQAGTYALQVGRTRYAGTFYVRGSSLFLLATKR